MCETAMECKVCHRLDFEGSPRCEKCGWPLREVKLSAPVFGCDVMIEVSDGTMIGTLQKALHYKGGETTARRRAKNVRRFIRVVAVRPLTRAQYTGAYGDPDLHCPFS